MHYPPAWFDVLGDLAAKYGTKDPRRSSVPRTADLMEALASWYQQRCSKIWQKAVPTILIGWSMGGGVVIESAARLLRAQNVEIRGVATIASPALPVQKQSVQLIRSAGAELRVLVGAADESFDAVRHSARLASWADVVPEVFPGEGHGVKSAFARLAPWVEERLEVHSIPTRS